MPSLLDRVAREGPWAQAQKGTERARSKVEIWATVFLQRIQEGKALINMLGESNTEGGQCRRWCYMGTGRTWNFNAHDLGTSGKFRAEEYNGLISP